MMSFSKAFYIFVFTVTAILGISLIGTQMTYAFQSWLCAQTLSEKVLGPTTSEVVQIDGFTCLRGITSVPETPQEHTTKDYL